MRYGQGIGVTEFHMANTSVGLHSMSEECRITRSQIPVSDQQLPDIQQNAPYRNPKKTNLYDPTFCRGSGAEKEGWCDHCIKSKFHLMKNSGYLYHKQYEHGIFPGGNVFEDPLVIRRKRDRESKWQGICGICYHWIDLDHSEHKQWGTWFRHYKMCVCEYEEIKKIIHASGAPVRLAEFEFKAG